MSEDCLLVAHGDDYCQDSETSSQRPQSPQDHTGFQAAAHQCLGKSPCPGVTCPPARHPQPGEIKLQLSSLGNSPSTFMAIRTRWTAGGPRRADHICHDWVKWGYGAPSRDTQGDGETASISQLKYHLSTHQLCALDTSPVSLVCKLEVILVPNSSSRPEDLTRPLKIFLTIWFKSILGTGQTS